MSERNDNQRHNKELGVDGEVLTEEEDQALIERNRAVEALSRNRAYLGREFLTWLLFRSNAGDPLGKFDDQPITVLVVGNISLRGLAGDATELTVKGRLSAYSDIVRYAIDQGLLVHTARLRLQHGEQVFEVTLDAEFLDFRGGDIPKVLSEEDEDQLAERLWLCERLGALIDTLWEHFVAIRTSPNWKGEVDEIKAWATQSP